MKILLFKTKQIESNLPTNSLKIALQFFPESVELYSDYNLNLSFEKNSGKSIPAATILSTDELVNLTNTVDEPIFIATSSTVFSVEIFNALIGAYSFFSTRFHSLVIQPTFDNDLLAYITPTLLLYGDRHIYSTGNRITNQTPILYGHSTIIHKLLQRLGSVEENTKPLFSDGIFYGGETVILSPMPPFAWNLDKELPVQVSSAEFDAKTYMDNIPDFTQF